MRKSNKIIHFIIYIILWNLYLNLINAITVSVKDETQLLNNLKNKTNDDELILDLEGKTFNFTDKISVKNSIKKIHIIGKSKKKTILQFTEITNGFIFTSLLDSNIQEIKFSNISIYGYLQFSNNINVILENAIINGSIDINKDQQDKGSNLDTKVTMKEITFNGLTNSKVNCLNLYGNVVIDDSKFYGNQLFEDSIIYYNGESSYSIKISNSYFNGMYSNNCISMKDGISVDINLSVFENCSGNSKSEQNFDGGGAVRVNNILSMNMNKNIFKNIYTSYYGGVFNIQNTNDVIVDGIEVFNSTSLLKGSVLMVHSSLDYLVNCTISNLKYYGNSLNSGGNSLANAYGYVHLYMNDVYAEDLYVKNYNSLFTLNIDSSIIIKKIKINRVFGISSDGLLLYTSYSEGIKPQVFEIDDGSFNNFIFEETNSQITAIIGTNSILQLTFKNCIFKNFNTYNTNFMFLSLNNTVIMDNVTIDEYHVQKKSNFIESVSYYQPLNILLNKVTISNFTNIIRLLAAFTLNAKITNSNISNKMLCLSTKCDDKYALEVLIDFTAINSDFSIDIINTTIDGVKGGYGIGGSYLGIINIYDSTIKNCFFNEGFILVDFYGMKTINIVNSKFINNSGSRGPVLNILNYSENYIINFNDTYFENNHANYYGGVVYSHRYFYPEDYIPQYNDYYFNNCVFINNTAKKGDISFSYEKRHEPIFSNIKELRKIKGAFVTNPSYIELTPDSKKSVTLYSGEKIPFEIKFRIFDEYNNIINEEAFETIDDMMLFDLELNDTANGKILGSPVYNCYVGYCTIPQIKILGKAGSYKLYYKLKTFGNYEPFKNSFGEIDINIKYCSNSSYLYQDIEKAGFKSCYLPQCETSCNKGRCVNMNVCDCSSTPYKGLYCNEYYIEEKSTAFMVFLKIISIILTIITIAFIIGIIKNRNDQKIKAASYNFLILILVGIIFNNIYLWILSMKETTILTCTYEYLFNYLGFSLVFGSIFVKTLRIFIIFEKINNSILVRNNIMYLIVLTILLYHVITVIFWIIFDNITVAKRYTVKEREYKQCTYPIWKKINTLFNLSLLLVDVSFSYANRHVKKNFKEHLTIPVYVYIVLTILMEFIDVDYEETQYVFDSFMMIINTSVILFFIFIRRYYKILLFNKTNANHIPLFISSNDLLRENKRVHY